MNLNKILTLGILFLSFSACSLSKTFHHPQKLPYTIAEMPSFSLDEDTTFIDYNKRNQEIKLSKLGQEVINEHYTIKQHFFKSSSGNLLNGWLLTPKNIEPKALILHFHGSASNLLMQYEAINPLIDYGYQIFTFDYSGYGYSEGKASRQHVLKDAYSALKFVTTTIKNDQKLLIYGQSYGGYLAAVVGSNRQNDIDGLVIEGAFSSHKGEANFKVPILGYIVKNEAIAAREIRKNHKPVLVIHSSEDEKVPLKFGEKIFENANQPKVFYQIDKPHIAGLQYYAKEIAEKIQEMLSCPL